MAFAELKLSSPYGVAPTISVMNVTAAQGSYRLAYDTFSPPVAMKRLGIIRKAIPYPDIEWDLTLNIHGYSAADAYQKLADLVELLMRVENWIDSNDPAYIVRLDYKPNGSIYGANVAGAGPYYMLTSVKSIKLPTNFEDTGATYVLLGVNVKFTTYGLAFLDPAATLSLDQVNLGASASLSKYTITYGSAHNVDYPYTISLSGSAGAATATTDSGAIFTSNAVNKLYIEPAIGTGSFYGARWSSVADAAGNYPPYNVARFSPLAANTPDVGAVFNSNAFPSIGLSVDIWALCRVNTAGRTFKLRVGTPVGPGGGITLRNPSNPVLVTATVPTLVYLGKVSNFFGNTNGIAYDASVDSVSGSPTLDILSFIFLGDDQYANALFFSSTYNKNWNSAGIAVDHNVIQSRYPFVSVGTANSDPFDYEGSPYFVGYGDTVACVLVLPRGAAWRMYRGAPDNVVQTFSLSSTRTRGLVTPK